MTRVIAHAKFQRQHIPWNVDSSQAFIQDDSECSEIDEDLKMNQRDQALLDKQLWGVSPSPPVNGGFAGVVSFILVVVFLTGLAIGAGLFAHDKQMQFVSHDAAAAIRF